MLRRNGCHFVIGYGENINVPTTDLISTERSFIGNLVGTHNDLVEFMTLQAEATVRLKTHVYPLDAALDAIHDLDNGRLPGGGGSSCRPETGSGAAATMAGLTLVAVLPAGRPPPSRSSAATTSTAPTASSPTPCSPSRTS